jgi:menaquinone-9 beta-reductase
VDSFDVVIVGGGPGGATAAWYLASAGRRVLIVDKATFPREKVCGDGLTPRAVKCLLDLGVETNGPGWSRAEGLRIVGAGCSLDMPWPELLGFPSYGLARTRLDFDSLLLDHARKAGAHVWEASTVTTPITDAAGVVTGVRVAREVEPAGESGNGETRRRRSAAREEQDVAAPVVIAFDGAASRMGMALGGRVLKHRPMGVAARTYYRSPRSNDTYFESHLELWRGNDLLPGYGWIFALPDGTVNVGLGMLNTSPHFGQVDYREVLEQWVAALPRAWGMIPSNRVGSIRGGPLPMAVNRSPLARPGFMIGGDAAGVVNPFNGEGIAYAMETGRMAAETALEILASGDPRAARGYVARVKEAYEGYFTLGRVFVRLIGNARFMGALTKYSLPNETMMRFAFKMLGNLTDPRETGSIDRLMHGLARLAPAVNAVADL